MVGLARLGQEMDPNAVELYPAEDRKATARFLVDRMSFYSYAVKLKTKGGVGKGGEYWGRGGEHLQGARRRTWPKDPVLRPRY